METDNNLKHHPGILVELSDGNLGIYSGLILGNIPVIHKKILAIKANID